MSSQVTVGTSTVVSLKALGLLFDKAHYKQEKVVIILDCVLAEAVM